MDGFGDDKHERVEKALDQVNALKYRYRPKSRTPRKLPAIGYNSDEDSSSEGSSDEGGNKTLELTLDSQIETLLQRTRSLAMQKIADNSARILTEEELISSESEDGSSDDSSSSEDSIIDERNEKDGDKCVDVLPGSVQLEMEYDQFKKSVKQSERKQSGEASASKNRKDKKRRSRKQSAKKSALRLAQTLSFFLSLPRVISYHDIEKITEALLEEPSKKKAEYDDVIDYHVETPRDELEDTSDARRKSKKTVHLYERRRTRAMSVEISDDEDEDMKLQQRRMFREANNFDRVSSHNFFSKSSHNSFRIIRAIRNLSGSALSLSQRNNSIESLPRLESTKSISKKSSALPTIMDVTNPTQSDGDPRRWQIDFNEDEYQQWRQDVKQDYLDWLKFQLEEKKRKKSAYKAKKGKKPRWMVLYEMSHEATVSHAPIPQPEPKFKY